MNCTSCGRPLPEGVAFCPACGAATPYNMPGQSQASPYDQTAASSPYGNGSSQDYPPLPPTVAANADNYPPQPQNPYTSYGAGMPQQPPYDPYNTPSAYPDGSPQPPANPMGSGPYYGAPPMSAYPQGMQPGAYPQGMQPGMYGAPPKKRSKVGLIVGISVLAVLLLCGGLIVAATQIGKSTGSTVKNSSNPTATTTTNSTPTTGNVPTSASVVPAAAKILFGVQTSNGVDADYNPTNVTKTFPTGKDVDLTFQVDSAGKDGFIKVKWYEDGQEVTSDILNHHAANNHGYFGQPFSNAGSGAATLSWCTKADCSDEQLAQIVSFTVTSTATVPSTNNTIAVRDWKRNND